MPIIALIFDLILGFVGAKLILAGTWWGWIIVVLCVANIVQILRALLKRRS